MRDYEQDSHVHRTPKPEQATPSADTLTRPAVSRSPALDVASLLQLQRSAGNAATVQLLADEEGERSPVHDVIGGGGSALDPGTRSTMESAFGASFDHVRVHTDDRASKSAESVGANAYTVGSDVVFKRGQFDPGSPTGQRTLAHELAHVVQQSQGPVDGTDAAGGIRVSDPSDRFERAADSTADHVMSSVQTSRAPEGAATASASPTAQLLEGEAAPAVQRTNEQEDEVDET